MDVLLLRKVISVPQSVCSRHMHKELCSTHVCLDMFRYQLCPGDYKCHVPGGHPLLLHLKTVYIHHSHHLF